MNIRRRMGRRNMAFTPEQELAQVRELAELKSQVSSVAQDVTKIVTQMDMVFELQREMARMQENHKETREALKRAFERIESSELAGTTLKSTTEKWINRGIGAWFVGTLLLGIIQFLFMDRVKGYENQLQNLSDWRVTIDRRIAWVEYQEKQKQAGALIEEQPK